MYSSDVSEDSPYRAPPIFRGPGGLLVNPYALFLRTMRADDRSVTVHRDEERHIYRVDIAEDTYLRFDHLFRPERRAFVASLSDDHVEALREMYGDLVER